MTEQEIMTDTERIISGNYSAWTIGVTDDLERRKQEHSNPSTWHHWNPDTEEAAREIEAYFVAKGCKGDVGGRGNADYVYIF